MTPTIKPTIKQNQAWELLDNSRPEKFVGFGGGAGGGKSWLACEWLLTNCYMYHGSRWFIARNELKRLMNSTFVTWGKVCKHHNIPPEDWVLDGKYNVIRFTNGSTIDLLDVAYKPTDQNYERFGSLEYTGGVGEEAGEWNFDAFDILKSRIGRHNLFTVKEKEIEIRPKFLLTFNPSRNWLYRLFYKPWKNNELEDGYAFVQTLYSDNPYTAKSYGEQLESIKNLTNKARLKDGNWEYDDDINSLTNYASVQDLFTNTIVKKNEKYLIVDVARYGRDKTVFNFFEGLDSYKIELRSKQGTDKTEQQIIDFIRDEKIPRSHVVVDEDGVGGGVVDHLKGVVGFIDNSSPINTQSVVRGQVIPTREMYGNRPVSNFANLKTQCAFKLADLIDRHVMSISATGLNDEISDDLLAMLKQKDIDKDGKLRIIPKDETKEAIGRSPDIGDTFLMRMYFELMEDAMGNRNSTRVLKQVFIRQPTNEINPAE